MINKKEIIKHILELKKSEECDYSGNDKHQPGCSCHMDERKQYNKALSDVVRIIKSEHTENFILKFRKEFKKELELSGYSNYNNNLEYGDLTIIMRRFDKVSKHLKEKNK